MESWNEPLLCSPYHARSNERFLRAVLLADVGRDDEALGWYESLQEYSAYDAVYRAAAHLGRARVHRRRGRLRDARLHEQRSAKLWSECDPELQQVLTTIGRERRALRRSP